MMAQLTQHGLFLRFSPPQGEHPHPSPVEIKLATNQAVQPVIVHREPSPHQIHRSRRTRPPHVDDPASRVRLKGHVPPPPDQLKGVTVARATTSRSVIRWTCSICTLCSIEHVIPVTPRTFSS